MSAQLAIGIDIGGTRTKFGLVDLERGTVTDALIMPTERSSSDVFLEQISRAVDQFKQNAKTIHKQITGIGMGIPGFTTSGGLVTTTYGFLDFMENYPLKEMIESKLSIACRIDNDARVVALGEAYFGEGKYSERVLTLTLGTGVGVGFVVKGNFIESLPLAHMGGHMKISDDSRKCYCGKTGCLEALVSSKGIIQKANEFKLNGVELSVEGIFQAALKGNRIAVKVVDQIIDYLHSAIHNYANLFAPGMIVLGGGVSKGLAPFIKRIKGNMYLGPYKGYDFELRISQLQEQAGILGSAALFQSVNQ